MTPESEERFIEAWGAMGALWGINRSVARCHALLMVSEEPLALEEIAERLQMSRGNASMSLKELRNFGVIRQVQRTGDRRDYYATEPDVWTMFFRIFQERKRREFDPALRAVRMLLECSTASDGVRERLEQVGELLDTMEEAASRLLADPAATRSALALLSGPSLPFFPKPKNKKSPT